jgi:hypothetical protein
MLVTSSKEEKEILVLDQKLDVNKVFFFILPHHPTLPYFLKMTLKIESFILIVSVKLIYIDGAYPLNFINKWSEIE